jgi:cation diffusion facilitator CzcD-associated flavoprotein CzcO
VRANGAGTLAGMRFAIIGGGMAGILSAIKLMEAGLDDFTVYEKADGLGGTWRENTYPGLSCDVPSHLYSYSFALNPDWSHLFAPGAEIESYFESVARDHEVERFVRFGDEVVAATYDDGRWQIETASGHRDTVDVVIAATGVLHHPRYPDLAGLDSFEGACFHSARWDHEVKLAGARVGVIGTGSTAIQITGALVGEVEHFALFQRTAQWILPSPNPSYTEEEKEAFRRDPQTLTGLHQHLADMFDVFANGVVDAHSPQMQMIAERCLQNLEGNVHDPELRERLRPDYQAGCKRLIMSGDFYDAIQHPGAELVTSDIVGVEAEGVRTADGVLHELDVLVLATGFQVDAFLRPMEVVGRGGVRLDEVWAERPSAYLSVSIPEFPNLFLLNGPNGPVGNFSLIEVAELQFRYLMVLIERLRSGEAREISATQQALDEHETARVEAVEGTVWVTGCQSWYLDDRGIPAVWPWPFTRFREVMAEPDLTCFDVR